MFAPGRELVQEFAEASIAKPDGVKVDNLVLAGDQDNGPGYLTIIDPALECLGDPFQPVRREAELGRIGDGLLGERGDTEASRQCGNKQRFEEIHDSPLAASIEEIYRDGRVQARSMSGHGPKCEVPTLPGNV